MKVVLVVFFPRLYLYAAGLLLEPSVTGNFAVGNFAAENFTVGNFAARKFRRKETSP